MKARLSRVESTRQNREAVLEAARRAFFRSGYHGASVDTIAEAAGFSKGVVYSQFGSKDELFLALLEERIEERRRGSAALAESLSGPEGVRTVFCDAMAVTAESVAWQRLLLEFRAHAARHPEVLARYAALHERTISGTADVLASLYRRAGTREPLPPRMLAVIALAMSTGLAAELLADPALDAQALARRVADGLVRPPSTGRPAGRARRRRSSA